MNKREFLKRVASIGIWTTPVIESVILPLHAQMSPPPPPPPCTGNTEEDEDDCIPQ